MMIYVETFQGFWCATGLVVRVK